MPLTSMNFEQIFNDSQTVENVLAEAEGLGLAPETREVLQDMVEAMGFARRDDAAKQEDKQFVLQGQMLVLGDATHGKTSLIKAMTGEKFDAQENKTRGVEFKFIDWNWNTIESEKMKFGDFSRYSEKDVCETTVFPRIFKHWNQDYNQHFIKGLSNFLRYFGIAKLSEFRVRASFVLVNIIFGLVFPILLGSFFGESAARWIMFGIIMTVFFLCTCRGLVSVVILLLLYSSLVGTSLAYRLYGCSDEPVPVRLGRSFLKDYIDIHSEENVPLFIKNPYIFFYLECFSLLSTQLILYIPNQLLQRSPFRGTILLNLVFDFKEEVFLPVYVTLSILFFFAPIGLSCYRSSIVFPIECMYIFLVHLIILFHQHILYKKYTAVVIAMEVGVAIPLCVIGVDNLGAQIIMTLILLCAGIGLHGHGKWLQYKHDFKGKSFTQVFLHIDFLIHSIKITKALIDVRKLRRALDEQFSTLKIKILDFAGDEEYYAYHPIFLNSDAFYVIVFNIQEYMKEDFKFIDSKVKRLRFWLESLYSRVPKGTPVFLVGTHRRNTSLAHLRMLNVRLRKAVWHSPFDDEIVSNDDDELIFFPVENSKGMSESGVFTLREKIEFVAENEFKDVIGQEIPFSWIKMQDALIQCSKDPLEPVCLTVEDFKKHFEHLYVEWDDEMLRYFHKKGFIIHVDKDKKLSKWVLLKPDALVQIIILLINPPQKLANKRGQRSHWTRLKSEGMISETLMQNVLSYVGEKAETSLIAFLEEYDVLCPLRHPSEIACPFSFTNQMTHIVPSLLPIASDSQTVWIESDEDKKFYIFFDHLLPEALFYRLVSRASKLTLDVHPGIKLVIYRDKGIFWLSPDQPYCIRLLKDVGQIEITFKPTDEDKHRPTDILCLIAGSMVAAICKRDFQNLSFHAGPECTSPRCPGSPQDRSSQFSGQRRRHVISVYPRPSLASFKCLNYSDKKEAKYWLP